MNKKVIKENKIIVKDEELHIILSEQIKKDGYMSIEEARRLTIERLNKRWEILKSNGN